MQLLVLGAGSIGKRHIKNLQTLGFNQITVFDPNKVEGIPTTQNYAELLKKSFDAVFVCSPPSLHLKQAQDFAERKSHLFIEKPLGDTLKGCDELIKTVYENNLISLVGCNMRFHPAIKFLKETVENNILGKIYHFRLEAAAYLPDWRPGTDYRKNYGAKRELGGGIILDGIHELDYANWIFGDATQMISLSGKVSDLEIDVEDNAEIVMKTKSGALGSIYLSYSNQPYQRGFNVSGVKGSIRWNAENKFVEIFTRESGSWKKSLEFSNFDINDCYLDMFRYFFNCIKNERDTFCNVKFAKKVLETALDARPSVEALS